MSGAGETDAGGAVSASVLGGSGMSVASSGVASGTMVSNSVLLVSGTASGTLTVSGGGNVANITLLGQYVVGQFTSASDGHGGTVIGDPQVMADTQSGTLTSPLA